MIEPILTSRRRTRSRVYLLPLPLNQRHPDDVPAQVVTWLLAGWEHRLTDRQIAALDRPAPELLDVRREAVRDLVAWYTRWRYYVARYGLRRPVGEIV